MVVGLALSVGSLPAARAQTSPVRTLVLYDTTGPYGWLGELYAIAAANLAGHFGTVTTKPVAAYVAGDVGAHTATIYLGSTYDEPMPAAFLTDVLQTTKPVIWAFDNIWHLAGAAGGSAAFATIFGWAPHVFDTSAVARVDYKGTSFTRSTLNAAGIMSYVPFDPARAVAVAEAVRPDGSRFPWAVRSKHLTYLGEVPFAYAGLDDRSVIFSDLLFDALAPGTPTRHRALVRLEDVGPDADPQRLRSIADYLYNQRVPFTFGVYPIYKDPLGTYNNGTPETIRLVDAPQVVSALKYMISKGGRMILHGLTHQYSNVANPYGGVSGDDFEFFRAHIDANNYVVFDGPVPEDSVAWAQGRIDAALAEIAAAGLPKPTIFEFPHYAASALDYQAVATRFTTRYDRTLYFTGQLSGNPRYVDNNRMIGQFFPYVVRDVYGTKVLPENLANYEPTPENNNPPRLPADIVATAKRNLAVRDGFASFFYHPYNGLGPLREIVSGIKALGYTFVDAGTL
jgi:uncharacterized protein YdaL